MNTHKSLVKVEVTKTIKTMIDVTVWTSPISVDILIILKVKH